MLFNSFEFISSFFPSCFWSRRPARQSPFALDLPFEHRLLCFCRPRLVHHPDAHQTVLDFLVARELRPQRSVPVDRGWLFVSLCGNLGLLAYFKYSALLVHTLEAVSKPPVALDFRSSGSLFPPGISFYTFQTLSYIIDVYRGECRAERNFCPIHGFRFVFPHLSRGP